MMFLKIQIEDYSFIFNLMPLENLYPSLLHIEQYVQLWQSMPTLFFMVFLQWIDHNLVILSIQIHVIKIMLVYFIVYFKLINFLYDLYLLLYLIINFKYFFITILFIDLIFILLMLIEPFFYLYQLPYDHSKLCMDFMVSKMKIMHYFVVFIKSFFKIMIHLLLHDVLFFKQVLK